MCQSGINKSACQEIQCCQWPLIAIVILTINSFSSSALGQCELQTIWSPDGGQDYIFGRSVAGSSDMEVFIVGEFGNNNYTGKVYIYGITDSQWQLTEELVAPDGPQFGAQFGKVVDMSADGKTLIISELLDANNGFFDVGAVWVYVEVGGKWTVQQKLVASDAKDCWVFGEQLALSADGNVAAISATGVPNDPVYVFTREGSKWSEAGILLGNGYAFGLPWIDVSEDGSVIAIGAAGDSEMGSNTGAVYIFVREGAKGTWMFRQKIFSSDQEIQANFGRSVSLSASGDTLIAGAIDSSGKDTYDSGAVYVFERKGNLWFEKQKLTPSDPQNSGHFGATNKLTPDGQRLIIDYTDNAPYLFDFIDGIWIETKRLVVSDPNVLSLGDAISITDDGSTVLLGAPSSKINGVFWYGAASLFDLDATLGDLNCDGVVSTADLLTLLSNWGYCFYWDPDEEECLLLGGCLGDLDLNCAVGTSDLLILLSNWG